jgi:hypothetical protein
MVLRGGNRIYSIGGMVLTEGKQNIEYWWNGTDRGKAEYRLLMEWL